MNANEYQVGDSVAVSIPMPNLRLHEDKRIEVAAKVRGVVMKKGRHVVVQLGTGHGLKRCWVSASRLRLIKPCVKTRRIEAAAKRWAVGLA